jgi:hypothetical protein
MEKQTRYDAIVESGGNRPLQVVAENATRQEVEVAVVALGIGLEPIASEQLPGRQKPIPDGYDLFPLEGAPSYCRRITVVLDSSGRKVRLAIGSPYSARRQVRSDEVRSLQESIDNGLGSDFFSLPEDRYQDVVEALREVSNRLSRHLHVEGGVDPS